MIPVSRYLFPVTPCEMSKIGVTRQSIIKVWLVERLQAEAANKPINDDAAGGAH